MLVGRLPFNGSQYEILQDQLKRKIFVRNIENKALANVIKKATEKVQCHRYSSIAEFRVAIDVAENTRTTNTDVKDNKPKERKYDFDDGTGYT